MRKGTGLILAGSISALTLFGCETYSGSLFLDLENIIEPAPITQIIEVPRPYIPPCLHRAPNHREPCRDGEHQYQPPKPYEAPKHHVTPNIPHPNTPPQKYHPPQKHHSDDDYYWLHYHHHYHK